MNTEKTWYIVDATDKILGRLASTIAIYIRGKNLATFTPSVDMGAFVIVVCSMYNYIDIMWAMYIDYIMKNIIIIIIIIFMHFGKNVYFMAVGQL